MAGDIDGETAKINATMVIIDALNSQTNVGRNLVCCSKFDSDVVFSKIQLFKDLQRWDVT